jgi:hypothetical protein
MMIDKLRTEIQRQIISQHGQVIVDALTQLDQLGLPSVCTYNALFERYKAYHRSITRLSRDSEYDEDLSDSRLAHYLERLDSLRPQRYVNVCGNCAACRNRPSLARSFRG